MERKRKWEEIGEEPTAKAKLAKVKEHFPKKFYYAFNNIRAAVAHEHPDNSCAILVRVRTLQRVSGQLRGSSGAAPDMRSRR
jgi:hypothetical protein